MDEEEIMLILTSEGNKVEGVRFTIPEGFTIEKLHRDWKMKIL